MHIFHSGVKLWEDSSGDGLLRAQIQVDWVVMFGVILEASPLEHCVTCW